MAYSDLDSILPRLSAQDTSGAMERMWSATISATSAATTTSGSISAQRMPRTFTIPSVSGYTGWELDVEMSTEDAGTVIAALEYNLGSLNFATSVFTAGVSMPTKDTRIDGTTYSSRQTSTLIPMMVVTSSLTATTPVITTTYTNEDGTGSRTSSLTLPTSPGVNTAFMMTPHLNSGDTGIQSVSNMTKSTGNPGTLTVYGLIPVAVTTYATSSTTTGGWVPSLLQPVAPVLATSGETLAFYTFGSAAARDFQACIFGRPI
jgi:hypothetical protein